MRKLNIIRNNFGQISQFNMKKKKGNASNGNANNNNIILSFLKKICILSSYVLYAYPFQILC